MKEIKININNIEVLIKIYKRSKKNIIMKLRGNVLELSIPKKSSYKLAEDILKNKEEWLKERILKEKVTSNKNEIYFLGKQYFLEKNENIKDIYFEKDKIIFEEKLQIKTYFLEKIKNIINDKLEIFSKKIEVKYEKVRIKYMKSAWGICYSNKNLSFNSLLFTMPMEIIEYVIIHELCHLKHLNHSKEFWALVEEHCPNYKKNRVKLKELSRQLDMMNIIRILDDN